MYTVQQFKNDVDFVFDIHRLQTGRVPFVVCKFNPYAFPDTRVNHYLVKSRTSSDYVFGEIDHPNISLLVGQSEHFCFKSSIDIRERYCYITVDQGWVEPGQALRQPGWHLDGLQGDEVATKVPGDIKFIWSDTLPTQFTDQGFDTNGLDVSKHNVFKWIEDRVDPSRVFCKDNNNLLAITSYHPHAAGIATERVYRRFVKVSYSYVPITSTRMTINPGIVYDYECHITKGEIPAHLV